jgi:hypothetical protein
VFGSVDDAQKASGDLVGATDLSMLVTALVEPGGDTPWFRSRFHRLLVEYGAVTAANLTTSGLKSAVTRTRPDDDGKDSFPSGHSTRAFATATMASANLEGTPMPAGCGSAWTPASRPWRPGRPGRAWKAGRHFQSDVLAGAAIGSFVSTWVRECFLRENPALSVDLSAGHGQWAVEARWSF